MNVVKKKPLQLVDASEERVLAEILNFFSTSGDFNGLPYYRLITKIKSGSDLLGVLAKLIYDGQICAVFGDRHPNPHILAFEPESKNDQVSKLSTKLSDHTCFYPTPSVLKLAVNKGLYVDRPFSLELALGGPCLSPRFFDLQVLEVYRNDPRYYYAASDSDGHISVRDQTDSQQSLKNSDQVLLESFGFGHNHQITHRVVVVYLRYLHSLSQEHQKIWQARQLDNNHHVHPCYAKATAGTWLDQIGIFDAFAMELQYINKMCVVIDRPHLFREDFSERKPPRNFAFLLRPTKKELHEFILTLDKCLSENLNSAFFQDEVPIKIEIPRGNGRFELQTKGTIAILDEWLKARFKPKDPAPRDEMVATLRRIRKLRQRPAHALEDDHFDDRIFQKQRDLICEAYKAIRVIRLILMNHPRLKGYVVPDVLQEGKIMTF